MYGFPDREFMINAIRIAKLERKYFIEWLYWKVTGVELWKAHPYSFDPWNRLTRV